MTLQKVAIPVSNLGPTHLPNMLREFDFAILPTPSDVICVKDEIRFTETNIKDLERQLEMLKRHLEMSKA
jgi:hypothetical protein